MNEEKGKEREYKILVIFLCWSQSVEISDSKKIDGSPQKNSISYIILKPHKMFACLEILTYLS